MCSWCCRTVSGTYLHSHWTAVTRGGPWRPGLVSTEVWLSVVVMVAVAGVLDVAVKRRIWLSRPLDVAEREVDSAGR